MQALELALHLSLWYGPGFVAAAVMSRRGHDSMAWTFIAWIAGALAVPAAVIWSTWLRRRLLREAHAALVTTTPIKPSPTPEVRP